MPPAKSTDSDSLSPMQRQYRQIKSRYPDHILLFRLGDFYETFERDAEIAAAVLDIVLTARDMGKGNRVALAGIPYHAADGYIAKLIAAGHKVAICEQISEPTKGKGLVERDVTRVVTPGTVVDPSMLDARANNYIAALTLDGKRAGLSFADITTGEFQTTEFTGDDDDDVLLSINRELLRLNVAELVVATDFRDSHAMPRDAWLPETVALSRTDNWQWSDSRAARALTDHFGIDALDGFGLAGKPFAIRAAGALLQYLQDTQMNGLAQISMLRTWSTSGFMTLDAQTRRNLELTESSRGERRHSLTAVLDVTRTPMGARLLRSWINQPLLDIVTLEQRLDTVEWFTVNAAARASIREALKTVGDIERLANRVLSRQIGPRELGQLRTSLETLPDLRKTTTDIPGMPAIPPLDHVTSLLQTALVDDPPAILGRGQVFRGGFSSDLDGHRARAADAREWIANLERTERERTGFKTLKVGYNKVFGYYLEITQAAIANADRDRLSRGEAGSSLPDNYIAKQTLANATRFFTPELKEYETLVLTAEDTLDDLEANEYQKLLVQVSSSANALLEAARAIGYLDTTSALADVAVARNYIRPVLTESDEIDIQLGRHPVLEAMLDSGEYIPNDARLSSSDQQLIILTGPNMAGKSSYLRQVALITLMAQIGSFVPATRATVGLVDRIFTRIGAQDDITTGQSTFMVEMLEMANILHHATRNSLVVLDEIGRGTSTWDGLAIARSIVEYVHNAPELGCKTLFATHYHELTELADLLPRVSCYRMDVLEEGERVVFLRRVVPGHADKSYGVHVARLAGIPKAITRRAEDVLAELEAHPDSSEARRQAMRNVASASPEMQLTFFEAPNPVLDQLNRLEIDSLTPLDAIRVLYELQREAQSST